MVDIYVLLTQSPKWLFLIREVGPLFQKAIQRPGLLRLLMLICINQWKRKGHGGWSMGRFYGPDLKMENYFH